MSCLLDPLMDWQATQLAHSHQPSSQQCCTSQQYQQQHQNASKTRPLATTTTCIILPSAPPTAGTNRYPQLPAPTTNRHLHPPTPNDYHDNRLQPPQMWEHAVKLAADAILDGLARCKRCSVEGRAAMSLDYGYIDKVGALS